MIPVEARHAVGLKVHSVKDTFQLKEAKANEVHMLSLLRLEGCLLREL